MRKYSESDYYYSAARIAAKSAKLLGYKEMSELCDSKDLSSALDRIREAGISVVSEGDRPDIDLTLTAFAAESYAELSSFLPDPEAVKIFTARYDCHNLKTAVKCRYMGIDPSPYYIECGSVAVSELSAAAESHCYDVFPDTLKKAAENADKALYENGSIRALEASLDAACFEYMSYVCEGLKYRKVKALLGLKVDLTNILTAYRLRALKNSDTAKALLSENLLSGGTVPLACFSCDGLPSVDTQKVSEYLPVGAMKRIEDSAKDGPGHLSVVCDRVFIDEVKNVCGMEQLGILPVARYIISLEYEIKNLRIVLSGISAGTSPEKIREELRY
ncbi:MAG: V-type ATPase subunit [Clostridia bacterium]|nr:V-type ATPase subunit [Clostridia bacterium]